MSFYLIFPSVAVIAFFVFRYFSGQKNNAVSSISESPSEPAKFVGEQAADNAPEQNSGEDESHSDVLSEDEIWLLKQFVCFPADYHTLVNIREVLCIGNADAAWADNLVRSLVKKGWISEPVHAEVYKMKSDIAEKVMALYPPTPDDVGVYAETVTNNLHIEKSVYEGVPDYPWIPFGQAILKRLHGVQDETIALLQNEMGMVLSEKGDYKGAQVSYSNALKFYESSFGEEHENTAVLYLNSANVLKQLEKTEEAKSMLMKALKYYEKNFGELHSDTGMIYNFLAILLQETDDYENAQPVLEKLLKADKHNFGENHQNTASSHANLARVCYACGDYKPALSNASRSLEIFTQLFPQGHDEIVAMKNGVEMIKDRMTKSELAG